MKKWVECLECGNRAEPKMVWQRADGASSLDGIVGAVMQHEILKHSPLPKSRRTKTKTR